MKSGKAPGADCVSAEMLKAGADVITETLTETFKEIWEEEEIPVDGRSESLNCQRKETSAKIGEGSHYCLSPTQYSAEDWLCWRSLNRLRTGVGRAKIVMRRWGYLDDAQSVDCDCGEPQTMAHLLSPAAY